MAQLLTEDWQGLPVATGSWEEASKERLYQAPTNTSISDFEYYEIMYLHHVKATSVCIWS